MLKRKKPLKRTQWKRGLTGARLSQVSETRKRYAYKYKEARLAYMQAHPVCEACGIANSEQLHHKKGRGRNYINIDTFMAVCHTCHTYIHAHPAESYEKGWMIKR